MSKTFKSDALAAIHETASDLSEAGLMDKRTMREFDKLCLTPVVALTSDEIMEIQVGG